MKNILLLIHDDEGQEARYQAALDVARVVEGHVTCVDVTILPEMVGDFAGVGSGELLLVEEQAGEVANKARMLARLEKEDVPFDWIDRTGFLSRVVEEQASLNDLVVLSSDVEGTLFPYMVDVTGDLLTRLGKPVLVVPPEIHRFDLHGHALIAWDGSADAEAALRAAMPLLRHAATVTLFSADDGSVKLPPEEAACYLSRHDIQAVVRQQPVGIDRPGPVILTEVRRGRYDYVVMGGYGHGRMMETLFGGTTRTMLRKSPVPMLIVHRR